jgi:ferric-dicitrate binding protein FerR (iron transport regulator)
MEQHNFLQRIAYLVYGYQQSSLTEAEQAELDAWLQAAPENRAFFEQMNNTDTLQQKLQQYRHFDASAGWEIFRSRHYPDAENKPRASRRLYWWSAAAAAVLLLGASLFLLRPVKHQPPIAGITPQQIMPGSTKAMLTLADGSTIPLDSAGTRVINQQGSTVKLQQGQLQYAANTSGAAAGLNTLTTPRGGQFRVTLPDGTRVWLNAASAITYPTAFSRDKREIRLKGEAYFEVAPQPGWPFRVALEQQASIDVLGTSFNVNAYTDEQGINTTLIRGAVRVNSGQTSKILQPGQQAQINNTDQIKVITNADTSAILAWKRGSFYFHDADIPTVMRQLARWYDVDIVYAGSIPARKFQGEIQRRLPLNDVLEGLEASGVHCRIKGRSIIVAP